MKPLTEDGVGRVHGHLVLGGVADETLRVGEGHVRRRRPVSLVVGDDFHFPVLEHAHARVRRAQIDTDSGCFLGHFGEFYRRFIGVLSSHCNIIHD